MKQGENNTYALVGDGAEVFHVATFMAI